MVMGITSKREMGLAVRALVQYADDCSGNGDYLEMNEAFKIALNMANMYELREEDQIVNTYGVYLSEALDQLKSTVEEGIKAQELYNKLR